MVAIGPDRTRAAARRPRRRVGADAAAVALQRSASRGDRAARAFLALRCSRYVIEPPSGAAHTSADARRPGVVVVLADRAARAGFGAGRRPSPRRADAADRGAVAPGRIVRGTSGAVDARERGGPRPLARRTGFALVGGVVQVRRLIASHPGGRFCDEDEARENEKREERRLKVWWL